MENSRNDTKYDGYLSVTVIAGTKSDTLQMQERESILEALIRTDVAFGAICGGMGRCGKCKIRLIEGTLPITVSDRQCLTEEELASGVRLSCKAYPVEPVCVELLFQEEADFVVVTAYEQDKTKATECLKQGGALGLAIDIGTTTIAMQLIALSSGDVRYTYTSLNHQRRYGADVISRIQAAVCGRHEELRESVCADLREGMREILKKTGSRPEYVTDIAIAGNTTMIHLLMGYDCKGLGAFPFTPVNIQQIESCYTALFGDDLLDAKVHIVPGISAFVGGDIVAGLYREDVDQKEEYSLLIDLGTNGEIALGNREKLLVTSTAAGPAFEGGNIQCGIGSVPGAIVGVSIEESKVAVKTIGDKPPVGLCGTGVIEAIAELLRLHVIDETGCLDDAYFETGYVMAKSYQGFDLVLTQQDIREIQLAKSAIRAGVEILFLRYGIKKEEISHVYLAGGFGFQLNHKKAMAIGLLPEEFAGKIEVIGNSSLSGAVKCLMQQEGWSRTSHLAANAKEISLSADPDFHQLYLEHMYFDNKNNNGRH